MNYFDVSYFGYGCGIVILGFIVGILVRFVFSAVSRIGNLCLLFGLFLSLSLFQAQSVECSFQADFLPNDYCYSSYPGNSSNVFYNANGLEAFSYVNSCEDTTGHLQGGTVSISSGLSGFFFSALPGANSGLGVVPVVDTSMIYVQGFTGNQGNFNVNVSTSFSCDAGSFILVPVGIGGQGAVASSVSCVPNTTGLNQDFLTKTVSFFVGAITVMGFIITFSTKIAL